MLKPIGSSSSLLEGTQVHGRILETGHGSDVNVQNSLISMYARRGEISESQDVFAMVRAPDLVISLINGMEVKMEGPCMISILIADTLGINWCVLMGANIANEASICSTYHAKFLVTFKEKKWVCISSPDCC
jgi:hypothetical protein